MKCMIRKCIVALALCSLMISSSSTIVFAMAGEETVGAVACEDDTDLLVVGIPTVLLAIIIVVVLSMAILGIVHGVRFLKKKSDDNYYFDEEDEDPEKLIR